MAESPIDPRHPALSSERPLFIDNQGGNTLDRAIVEHLRVLRAEGALPYGLDIATAFFNVPGFELLSGALGEVAKVRLLLGAEPVPEAVAPARLPGDPAEPEWTRRQVQHALDQLGEGLKRSVDLLPFDDSTDRAIRALLEALHGGKVECRRYARHFLHAKAYLFRTAGGGTIVGSSNLTYAGLRNNLELNLGQYADPVVARVEQWYDRLWDQAEPFDLASLFDRLMAEFPPYLIYLRTLLALYGEELEQEAEESAHPGEIPVTTFQQHGIWRALRILQQFGGVIVADGVGLGKTFLAGEIIRRYRERRQRVLLVCPAALRDSTWKKFQDRFDLKIATVSYEELAMDRHFGGTGDALGGFVDEYQLVVVDVLHDRSVLERLRVKAAVVKPDADPKLAMLVEELATIAKQAKDEAIDKEDERRKRKVLIFSFYADTVDWIEEFLRRVIDRDPRLAVYRGRTVSVAGDEARGGVSRKEAVYLRFIPLAEGSSRGPIVKEVGTCLRMIECAETTPITLPADLKQTAHTAWRAAQRDIFEAWTFETDPANLQPKVSKFNRDLADFLRANQPDGVAQARFEACLDAIEAPCSMREQNMLRVVFDGTHASPKAKSKAIVEEVEKIGLEPFHAPEPLPPIEEVDVHLVCWMALERCDAGGR